MKKKRIKSSSHTRCNALQATPALLHRRAELIAVFDQIALVLLDQLACHFRVGHVQQLHLTRHDVASVARLKTTTLINRLCSS